MEKRARLWWERNDLRYHDDSLRFAGLDLHSHAKRSATPGYVYSADRMRTNLLSLKEALHSQGVPHRIFYALKSNRFLPVVNTIQSLRLSGLDVCSPREMLLGIQAGFAENEISYTGTSISNSDLDIICKFPGTHFNCDSLSVIRRLGERCPGRQIGIRVNLQVGAGFQDGVNLEYAGEKPTKFGIFADRYEEALALARKYGFRVTTLHFHLGSGFLNEGLPKLAAALERISWFLERCPSIEIVDIGGGMGIPLREDMVALDLTVWARIVAAFMQRNKQIREILLEPGDFIMKDAGLLIVEVNSVENKGGTIFVGVNAGQNIHVNWAYYKIPFVVVPLKRRPGRMYTVTVAGNINEVGDLLAENIELPLPEEGDFLALLNTGGYGSSMSSDHCMRGSPVEYLIPPLHKL